jgi:hypothetical protein
MAFMPSARLLGELNPTLLWILKLLALLLFNGALRVAAWKDGGSNDICPVGFSVPTNDELHRETLGANSNT